MCVDDLLHNVETESDSFLIDARCPEQFTKSCEKFRSLLIRYTDSSVLHHHCQLVDWPAIVNHLKRDETYLCELESITDQVYHDLLYPSFIANQFWYLGCLIYRKLGVIDFHLLNSSPHFYILGFRLRTEYLQD